MMDAECLDLGDNRENEKKRGWIWEVLWNRPGRVGSDLAVGDAGKEGIRDDL